jgi:hypothetical protein
MTRTSDDYGNALIFGVPLPPMPELEVPLPDNVFVCLGCGKINNYFTTCEKCETHSELADRSQEV